jgi:NAD-dependent dihydropyrimidine dehydrogenase PreA subunit
MELKHGLAGCSQETRYSCFEVNETRCNKCGDCVDMCPMDVLRFSHKGYPYMHYPDDCWYCDTCVFVCPRKAVKMDTLPYLIR